MDFLNWKKVKFDRLHLVLDQVPLLWLYYNHGDIAYCQNIKSLGQTNKSQDTLMPVLALTANSLPYPSLHYYKNKYIGCMYFFL